VSLRPAWATQQDQVSKNQTKQIKDSELDFSKGIGGRSFIYLVSIFFYLKENLVSPILPPLLPKRMQCNVSVLGM
jgi:hypothetical protein